MQSSLFDTTELSSQEITLPLDDADIRYIPGWLSPRKASEYYQQLAHALTWQQDTIKLYGKEHLIPRQQAWIGDPTAEYGYSGIHLPPQPWQEPLLTLRDACQSKCQTLFNSVLANWYQHGQHSMGMHSDDEPQLGRCPVIASVSLGETRQLIFRHKRTKARYSLPLQHGSLLIMAGETQHHWQHGINKTAKAVSGRINLTFRRIINDHTTANHR